MRVRTHTQCFLIFDASCNPVPISEIRRHLGSGRTVFHVVMSPLPPDFYY